MSRPEPRPRADFRWFVAIATRWADNDMYGHVNNAAYYGFFDAAVNRFLIEAGALDPLGSGAIGLVVETGCAYFAPLSFPETITVGIVAARVGSSSVRYEIGIFGADAGSTAAHGHFVHVMVDRLTRRPVPIPPALSAALATIAARGT